MRWLVAVVYAIAYAIAYALGTVTVSTGWCRHVATRIVRPSMTDCFCACCLGCCRLPWPNLRQDRLQILMRARPLVLHAGIGCVRLTKIQKVPPPTKRQRPQSTLAFVFVFALSNLTAICLADHCVRACSLKMSRPHRRWVLDRNRNRLA
jgi:hypothetical protein